ncbi:MAG TPA: GlsB/YeaQ/YmgE family stress response membrane protein [Roseiarcus sp.]|nr:GlsB/YeaQ/YmgE family stress response membrane protein [Roseiarcus sp.]
MGWIAWIILGLIAGFIGSKIVNKSGSGIILDVVIGVVGAVIGGEIGARLGLGGVNGLNLWSLLLAVIGAVIVLLIYNAVARRA